MAERDIWTSASEVKETFFSDFDKSVEKKINEICRKIVDGETCLIVPYKKESAYIEMFAKQLLKDDPLLKNYYDYDRNFNLIFRFSDKFELENSEELVDEIWEKYENYRGAY